MKPARFTSAFIAAGVMAVCVFWLGCRATLFVTGSESPQDVRDQISSSALFRLSSALQNSWLLALDIALCFGVAMGTADLFEAGDSLPAADQEGGDCNSSEAVSVGCWAHVAILGFAFGLFPPSETHKYMATTADGSKALVMVTYDTTLLFPWWICALVVPAIAFALAYLASAVAKTPSGTSATARIRMCPCDN